MEVRLSTCFIKHASLFSRYRPHLYSRKGKGRESGRNQQPSANFEKLHRKSIPGIKVIHKHDVWKLQCTLDGATVKIEVNGTKRGIIGETEDRKLCERAETEFNMTCKARTVSYSQLYGGKIAAALSRQHPRDLFDCKYMEMASFHDVKNGFMLCLLGSDKPVIESLQPNAIDQTEALEKQFEGMSDTPFTYSDYEEARHNLIQQVNDSLTETDREFLLSFENGEPDWENAVPEI